MEETKALDTTAIEKQVLAHLNQHNQIENTEVY
jgi:hypothetical protein